MFCPNCGKENPDGVAFCAGCGMAIGSRSSQPVAAPAPQPVVSQPAPEPVVAPVIPQPQPKAEPKKESSMLSFGQHFKNLIKAATHPVTGPAEIAGQYDKIGNALFLAGIVIVVCWLVGFFSSLTVDLVQLARFGKYAFDSFGLRVVKDFFFPCIYYAIRVFGCAGVFMLAGLIVKEKWSFPKLLAISAMATAPAFIVSDMLGSIVGLIPYVGFGSLFTIAAYAYYLLMIYEGMGAETKLTGNKKGFVLVICVAITGFIAHYF
jgi:hypothetical protein